MEIKLTTDEMYRRLEEQKFALNQSAIVAQTDIKGNITYVNDRFCQISEYRRSELIGKNHRIVNSGTHPKDFFNQMWGTISQGLIWRGDVCNRAKSGRLYWVATTIVPLLDADGKPDRYLAVRQDISALKEAERVILEQQAQMIANSKMSAVGEMAAAITHEINNPLGVILGRCEMIKNLLQKGDIERSNLERLVDTIEVTGHRIEKIVRSMKTLAHAGEQDPFLKTSVAQIVRDLNDLFLGKFEKVGVRFEVNDIDETLFVECRSHEILQVLVNLLNNSLDALQILEEKWIRLHVQKLGSEIEISMTDSGTGIPTALQEKLFMPFFSTKRVQYGTGLGLSISRSLIQRHQGRLEYDSSSPHTRFLIRIPVTQKRSD
jgi:PAS domain S-box-containing protein